MHFPFYRGKDPKMKKLFALLLVSLLSELGWSMEAVESQNLCYKVKYSTTGQSCFTTFHNGTYHAVRKSFDEARDWCKRYIPGSSLIVVNSADSQASVNDFTDRRVLAHETIITDARKLSSGNNLDWSWINGHQTIPTNVKDERIHDGACLQSLDGRSFVYCTGSLGSKYRYICEKSGANWKSDFSFQQNSKSYITSEYTVSWYEARDLCLRIGADLASITDLSMLGNWSRLKNVTYQQYWIGLLRNMWIWNSTGAALIYANWDGGEIQDESSVNNECICINPRCVKTNYGHHCIYIRQWRTCSCNDSYAFACQKDDTLDSLATKNIVTERMLQSTVTPQRKHFSENQTAKVAPSSTGLFQSFTITELLLVLFFFVTVVLIVLVAIFFIRKFKKARRNEESSLNKIDQYVSGSPEYETMVRNKKRRPGDAAPIYTELELAQRPTPSSSIG